MNNFLSVSRVLMDHTTSEREDAPAVDDDGTGPLGVRSSRFAHVRQRGQREVGHAVVRPVRVVVLVHHALLSQLLQTLKVRLLIQVKV